MKYIIWNDGLDDSQAGIKIVGRNINHLEYADGTTSMAESKEELKSFLIKVKEESEKADLKFNIQKTKITASSPNTSSQIEGGKVETVRFHFLGLQNHCRQSLQLWKKSYDKPRQCIKNRDITLITKVHIVKAMVFPIVRYGCKSWTTKKAECWRIDAFELWC